MIGVLVSPAEKAAATEFFELCKTPWALATPETADTHPIVVTTDPAYRRRTPGLLLHYSRGSDSASAPRFLLHAGRTIPLYTGLTPFSDQPADWLREAPTGPSAVAFARQSSVTVLRFGFALFAEIRHLLVEGQPVDFAASPTLDLHFALLRDAITRAGHPFVEIPPVPAPHPFAVCLTHDIDHPIQRNHCTDHAMLGFVYRATVGTLLDVVRGKKPTGSLLRNGLATAKLPFVALGWTRDEWAGFDRYLEIEAGMGATYFAIPRAGYPGRRENGPAPPLRASRYQIADILPQLRRIAAAGQEIGLHGLDAWIDADAAQRERAALPPLPDESARGVRMHWLYFNSQSPHVLDRAGFAYDSTVGYNQTIGFRAGTAQAFRPLGTHRIWELPLHVMDTALFYPSYLNLSPATARERVGQIVAEIVASGGALTVNWHDRSIAPERLWEPFYRELLASLQQRGAWFARATDAVAWFQRRRQVELRFASSGQVTVHLPPASSASGNRSLPGMVIRLHPGLPRDAGSALSSAPRSLPVDQPISLQPHQPFTIPT